jgi:hypothetical protein
LVVRAAEGVPDELGDFLQVGRHSPAYFRWLASGDLMNDGFHLLAELTRVHPDERLKFSPPLGILYVLVPGVPHFVREFDGDIPEAKTDEVAGTLENSPGDALQECERTHG